MTSTLRSFTFGLGLYFSLMAPAIGQRPVPFEGMLVYVRVITEDSTYHQKNLETFKNLGWNDLALTYDADSLWLFYWVRGDTIWQETRLSPTAPPHSIGFQVGFFYESINPQTGARTVFSKTAELQKAFDELDPAKVGAVKVSKFFRKDYSVMRRIGSKQQRILGWECQQYLQPTELPGSVQWHWFSQAPAPLPPLYPCYFDELVGPYGWKIRDEYHYPGRGVTSIRELRQFTAGPVAPIAPRLQQLDLGDLDGTVYQDSAINATLLGQQASNLPQWPDFAFYGVNDRQVHHLSELLALDKYLLLDLWGTWCGPCLATAPKLKAFAAENASRLQVIGLNFGDQRADHVQATIAAKDLNWPQFYLGRVLRQFIYPHGGVPHAFLLDPSGKLVWQGNPITQQDALRAIVQGY